MKTFLKILAALIVLILASIIVLPIVFKDDIIAIVKEQTNENLNAKVDFGDFDLSLISSFPNFTFYIKDVKVDGVDRFEGITLAKFKELSLSIDLGKIISSGGADISIKKIALIEPTIHVVVLDSGFANYDIVKASDETEVEEPEDTSATPPFKLALKSFKIENLNLIYDDQSSDIYAGIKNLNFDLIGDFTASTTDLTIATAIEAITVKMDGIKYLNKASFKFDAGIAANMDSSKFTFSENKLALNEIELGFEGWVQMIEEDIDMDIKFKTNKTDFRSVLSLVPAVYMTDFSGLETKGSFNIEGFAKGMYKTVGEDMLTPAFAIDMGINDAMFKYPDLPSSVDNINVKVDVKSIGGALDNLIVEVSKFHIELAGNPFDIGLTLKTPMSDPFIAALMTGTLDFGKLKEIIPLEKGDKLEGIIESNVSIMGNMSTIEQERYEDFKAEGSLILRDMNYASETLPYAVKIDKTALHFTPKEVKLEAFDCKIGNSDFHATGSLENFIPYALKDGEVLRGKLNYWSDLIDANEFLEEDSTITEGDVEMAEGMDGMEEEPLSVIEIPKNIDFVMDSKIAKLLYDKTPITNIKGEMVVRDQKVVMKDVEMYMLKGKMIMGGSYETTNPAEPSFDFLMDIQHFDVNESAVNFNTIESMAPVAKHCVGSFSTDMTMKGKLDLELMPKMMTLTGGGSLLTDKVALEGHPTLKKVADAVGNPALRDVHLNHTKLNYVFKDGKVTVDPFDFIIGQDIYVEAYGWNGFDSTLDWSIIFDMPMSQLKGFDQVVTDLMAQIKLAPGDRIKVPVRIHGRIDDPIIGLDKAKIKEELMTKLKSKAKGALMDKFGLEGDNVKEAVKEKAKEEVKEKVDNAKAEAYEKAKAEGDKLIAEANKQADQVRAEGKKAATAIRSEADKQAQQLLNEAKNPLAKKAAQVAGDKLKQEADTKAKQTESTANKKADGIVNTAKQKAQALLDKAK